MKQHLSKLILLCVLMTSNLSLNYSQTFNSQKKLSASDSVIVKTYRNKILPKAVNSKNDVLYNSIDNTLMLQYPDEKSKTFKYYLKSHNGIVYKAETGSGFNIIPKNSGRAFISIFVINKNNDTILIGKKEFAVLNIPLPCLKVKNIIIKDQSTVDRRVFFTGDSVKVLFSEDIPSSDTWCIIERFNIGYAYGGVYVSIDNESPILTSKTLDFMKKLKPAQELVIKVTSISPTGIIRHLPIVRFKII
jgi:GldM C-terminal domain